MTMADFDCQFQASLTKRDSAMAEASFVVARIGRIRNGLPSSRRDHCFLDAKRVPSWASQFLVMLKVCIQDSFFVAGNSHRFHLKQILN
jgi:hypothetical protein